MYIPHSRPFLNKQEFISLGKVLQLQYIAQGNFTKTFEQNLSKFLQVKHALAVSSGTAALHLALLSLNIKKNDEVIIPDYSCAALLNAIIYCQAKPIICDITDDFNLDPFEVAKKISKKTKAIILVHSFGQVANLSEFLKFNIPLIEDITHSIGAKYKNKFCGTFGTVAVCSFYATKFITTGEGGAIFTNQKNIYNLICDLKDYDKKNIFKLRYNYKITDLQSAMGISQLKKINTIIKNRKKIALTYFKKLPPQLILPKQFFTRENIFYRFVVLTNKKNKLKKFLNKKNIQAKEPVFKPLHHYLNLNKKKFPFTEHVFNKALSLPIYPDLTLSQTNYIIKTLNTFFKRQQ